MTKSQIRPADDSVVFEPTCFSTTLFTLFSFPVVLFRKRTLGQWRVDSAKGSASD